MSKKVLCTITEKRAEVLWDITWADLVEMAVRRVECWWVDLALIKEEFKKLNEELKKINERLDLVSNIPPWLKPRASWFTDTSPIQWKIKCDLKQWWEAWLTEKQKTFVDYRIWMVIEKIRWNWFNWGWVKRFDELEEIVELKGDAYLYAKDYVKDYVDNNPELDYTCFEF